MNAKKYKHLSFEDRCVIEDFLNYNYNFTQIANRLHKDRTTISNEVRKHRFLRSNSHTNVNNICCFESKPPYVCNGCSKFNNCRKIRYSYSHAVSYNEYKKTLSKTRSHLKITKEEIASINDIISPLMIHKHHSVNQVYISHPELLPFSKSPNLEQINDMLNKAFNGIDLEGLILHSDQGWQYQHQSNQQRLKNKGIKQSMSRKGNSMDNGMMENFFGLLKTEMFYDQEDSYKTSDDLIKTIDEYIYYYNYDRIKVKLKGLSPVNYRLQSSCPTFGVQFKVRIFLPIYTLQL